MIATEQRPDQRIEQRPEQRSEQRSEQRIEQRILDELIYDRVRSNVNLCQLVIVEQELEESIQRAVDGDAAGVKPGALAREHVQRAWQRLEREWSTLRHDLSAAEDT